MAKWQTDQAKFLQACLKGGAVFTHIDFIENYSFEVQNEIQSMYYHSDQVSILVQVTYSVDNAEEALEGTPQLKRETYFYI